jgi:hypothetical protein
MSKPPTKSGAVIKGREIKNEFKIMRSSSTMISMAHSS